MNRRAFLAGLLASVAAPAVKLPVEVWVDVPRLYVSKPSMWADLRTVASWPDQVMMNICGVPESLLGVSIGEFNGIVFRETT